MAKKAGDSEGNGAKTRKRPVQHTMNIAISEEAKAKLRHFVEDGGRIQVDVLSRLVSWFVEDVPAPVQDAVVKLSRGGPQTRELIRSALRGAARSINPKYEELLVEISDRNPARSQPRE